MTDTPKNGLIRVNFSLRGFAKVVSQDTLSPLTPEPAALQSFGRYLASLNLTPDNPLTFASIAGFRGLDYVGYIVEKERLDPTDGTWVRVEEYRIMGTQACSYKDTRVAYGETYRYRIRSVVKFTGYEETIVSYNDVQRNLSSVLQSTLAATTNKNLPLLQRLVPQGLQSKANTNSLNGISLGSNVSVNLDAQGHPKFNYNLDDPALQTLNSAAVKSLTQLQAALASPYPISDGNLQSLINGLQNYTPNAQPGRNYMSEYLVSYPSRNWQYVVVRNNKLPIAPQSISVIPSTPKKSMSIYWLVPPDEQRDLSGVKVYRRNAVGDPWALLATVPQGQPYYVDKNLDVSKKYIYALQCTNLHGYEGFLSTQVQAEFNSSFNFEQKEKELTWISGPGARPDEPNTIFAAFYDTAEQLIAYKNISIQPSKVYNDTQTKVVVKIKSLDTHEEHHVYVNLKNQPVVGR